MKILKFGKLKIFKLKRKLAISKPKRAAFVIAIRINNSYIECLMVRQKATKKREKPWGFAGGNQKIVDKEADYPEIAERRAKEKTGLLFTNLADAIVLFQREFPPSCFLFHLEQELREPKLSALEGKVLQVKWFRLDEVKYLPLKLAHRRAYENLIKHLSKLAGRNKKIRYAANFKGILKIKS